MFFFASKGEKSAIVVIEYAQLSFLTAVTYLAQKALASLKGSAPATCVNTSEPPSLSTATSRLVTPG